eukprot:g2322.t1
MCLVSIDFITSLLYMGLIRVLAQGLVCTASAENNDAGRLVVAHDIKCFDGLHLAMAPCALVGICCLYPAVVLTRPLLQIYNYVSTVTFREDDSFVKMKQEMRMQDKASKEAKVTKKTRLAFESEQARLEEEKKYATSTDEFLDIQERQVRLQDDRDAELQREEEDAKNSATLAENRRKQEEEETGNAFKNAENELQVESAHYTRDLANIASHLPPRFIRMRGAENEQQYLFKDLDEQWYVGDALGDNTEERRQAKLRSGTQESLVTTTLQWEWAKPPPGEAGADKWAVAGTSLPLRADVTAFKFLFDYNYTFFLAQVQTLLAVVATVFADNAYVVLITALAADVFLLGYFLRKAPCSIPSINTIAVAAYGFSLWINIASLVVTATGNDFIGAMMIYTYAALAVVISLLVCTGVIVFRVLCLLLYLSSNCLALVSMVIEDFEGLGGKRTGVHMLYAVLANDFIALFGLTCWYWCSMGGLQWLARQLGYDPNSNDSEDPKKGAVVKRHRTKSEQPDSDTDRVFLVRAFQDKSESELALVRRERDGYDDALTALKKEMTKERELLNIQELDISKQSETNKLKLRIKDKSHLAEKEAKDTHDRLEEDVKNLNEEIETNEAEYKEKSLALQAHQQWIEQDVVTQLDKQLAKLQQTKEFAERKHETLKAEKKQGEENILQTQLSLEIQVKRSMKAILAQCRASQQQFDRCLQMIESRNEALTLQKTQLVSEGVRLLAAVKSAAVEADANYQTMSFDFTTNTLKKSNAKNTLKIVEVDATNTVKEVFAEAKGLGMQENDVVDAVIVQEKPVPAPPTWESKSQDLKSDDRTLVKIGESESWGFDGALSQEII